MAGHVLKRRRLVNPAARRRRRMSPAQKFYFGTRRQRAAMGNAGRGSHRKVKKAYKKWFPGPFPKTKSRAYRRLVRSRAPNQGDFLAAGGGLISRAEHAAEKAIERVERAAEQAIGSVTSRLNRGRRRNAGPMSMRKTIKRMKRGGSTEARIWERRHIGRRKSRSRRPRRRRNVGQILTVVPANPGRRKNMYRTHNRRRRRNRRRSNWRDPRTGIGNRRRRMYNRRRRRHNPGVYNRRRRLFNRRRRRNPGFVSGKMGAVVGILGGATITKMVTAFLPSTITTGWAGYAVTGVTAVVMGNVTGKVMKNRQFGNWVMTGGLLILALELLGKFFPTLQLPFGLSTGTSGLGLISSSNFYVPQVNLPGSMASFVTPAGVTGAIPVVPSAMHGLGGPQFSPGLRTMRRIGRMR